MEDRQDTLGHTEYLHDVNQVSRSQWVWKNFDTELTGAPYVADILIKLTQSATPLTSNFQMEKIKNLFFLK